MALFGVQKYNMQVPYLITTVKNVLYLVCPEVTTIRCFLNITLNRKLYAVFLELFLFLSYQVGPNLNLYIFLARKYLCNRRIY